MSNPYGRLYTDLGLVELIREHGREFAEKSRKAKTPEEYGAAEDVFVAFVMAYMGYKRGSVSLEDIRNRKEIWIKEEE